jgi:RNA polymerase sigma factor (sigma-70 family)
MPQTAMSSRKKNWSLTRDSLDRLLLLFDEEPRRAGEKYELMRVKLIRFFQCRGCQLAPDLADEVMNRVARRAQEGEEIRVATLGDYFYGVARNVLREFIRSPENASSPIEELELSPRLAAQSAAQSEDLRNGSDDRHDTESRLDCLESCLAKLPAETRDLVISYYQEEAGRKVRNRQRLAESMGVPMNALRIRVHRIRAKLETCVCDCLRDSPGWEMKS